MAIAYFSTWTTYGTWLPGDERGWTFRGGILQMPDATLRTASALRMVETAVELSSLQRVLIEGMIQEHCEIRGWECHAVKCLSNHVHVLVTASGIPIDRPREQFKYWGTRRLKTGDRSRKNWWTDGGWDVFVDEEEHLAAVREYIREGQEWGDAETGACAPG